MLFSSTVFIFVFLPAVLIGYYLLLRGMKARNALLLAASLLFYAWGEPVYVLLMLLSIAVNYVFGRLLERRAHSKTLLVAAVIFNLGLLFYFKYLNFTVDNLNALFGLHLSVPALALPIGISFFTFQAMSYVIDVYRGTAPVQCNVLSLGLYISFFPQLIAGPIVRYNSIAAQIEERRVAPEDFQAGVCRFIEGFAKKIILANNLSLAAEKAFALAGAGEISTAMAWLGSLAYTFQIYFDFSGYSDMAIGLGRMFGFRFEENFRYPYLSRSVSEFWNRWHISLGHWFRDYVYFAAESLRGLAAHRRLARGGLAVHRLGPGLRRDHLPGEAHGLPPQLPLKSPEPCLRPVYLPDRECGLGALRDAGSLRSAGAAARHAWLRRGAGSDGGLLLAGILAPLPRGGLLLHAAAAQAAGQAPPGHGAGDRPGAAVYAALCHLGVLSGHGRPQPLYLLYFLRNAR